MAVVSMKALLESGVHFGHRTNKWNPGMKPYIFTERNGIHIIDLQQTVKALNNAFNIVRDAVAGGGVVMFVGTKRQAQETVHEEAVRCGMPYVTERWLGGMLTNWSTMYQRIQELERLEKLVSTGEIEQLTKKEGLLIQREITRLNIRLSGVRSLIRRPDMLFVVDVMREDAAVHEANLLDIPVVALVDTNCDPKNVDFVIPSNDDAIRAIKLLVGKMADAVLEGKAIRKDQEPELEEEFAPVAEIAGGPDIQVTAEFDVELEDDELLGKATLAKLAPLPKLEVTPVEKETEFEETPIEKETKLEEKPAKKKIKLEEKTAEKETKPVEKPLKKETKPEEKPAKKKTRAKAASVKKESEAEVPAADEK